jgi:transporter family-2 protein
VQQAANGHIRRLSGDVLIAVLVNFVVGTAALLAVCLVRYGSGRLGSVSWPGSPLWLYTGGVLGVVFVAVSTATVRLLGVLRLTLAVVAGQLFGAVLLDVFWRTASRPTAQLYAAVLLVLVAVSVAGRGTRPVPSPR